MSSFVVFLGIDIPHVPKLSGDLRAGSWLCPGSLGYPPWIAIGGQRGANSWQQIVFFKVPIKQGDFRYFSHRKWKKHGECTEEKARVGFKQHIWHSMDCFKGNHGKKHVKPMKISQGTADAQPFAFGSAFSIKIKGLSDYPSNVLIQKNESNYSGDICIIMSLLK